MITKNYDHMKSAKRYDEYQMQINIGNIYLIGSKWKKSLVDLIMKYSQRIDLYFNTVSLIFILYSLAIVFTQGSLEWRFLTTLILILFFVSLFIWVLKGTIKHKKHKAWVITYPWYFVLAGIITVTTLAGILGTTINGSIAIWILIFYIVFIAFLSIPVFHLTLLPIKKVKVLLSVNNTLLTLCYGILGIIVVMVEDIELVMWMITTFSGVVIVSLINAFFQILNYYREKQGNSNVHNWN